MRWYNEVLEDGTNEWKYERATDEQIINATDKMVFWIGLMVWPVIWSTLTFFYVIQLRLDWVGQLLRPTNSSDAGDHNRLYFIWC